MRTRTAHGAGGVRLCGDNQGFIRAFNTGQARHLVALLANFGF
jgi:hypothetical protein